MSFENYRKAKKGEITCEQCKFSRFRWWSKRLECAQLGYGPCQAVGKHHTCDTAEAGSKIEYASLFEE